MTTNNWASIDAPAPKGKKASKKATTSRKIGQWDIDADQAESIYGQWGDYRAYRPRWTDLYGETALTDEDAAKVARLEHAARVVQTFVDALSGENSNYSVGISATASTAATNLKDRTVVLPAKVILDESLSDMEAASLMVGYVMHEIGHIRHDDDLDQRLRSDADPVVTNALDRFNSLSVILRENRVEAGATRAFPGYGGVFQPLLRWVSRETADGSKPPQDALGFAIAATRYPFRFDWSDPKHAAEAAWWVGWRDRSQWIEDYEGHKAALIEAEEHIQATLTQPQDGKSGKPPYSTASANRSPNGFDLDNAKWKIENDASAARMEARAELNDGTLDREQFEERLAEITKEERKSKTAATKAQKQQAREGASIPASIEDARDVDEAAEEATRKGRRRSRRGGTAKSRAKREAEYERSRVATVANAELGMLPDGERLDDMNEKQRPYRVPGFIPSTEAVSTFRSMFMRLRGGYDGRIGNHRRGRLDERKVWRLGTNDDRVFTRRGAAKTQRIRLYVMVDVSGSMGGTPIVQARGVAHALTEASVGADTMHLEVFGWDTEVYNAYRQGDDPLSVTCLQSRGGTDDAGAVRWASRKMQGELSNDEQGVIIMLSDGCGQGSRLLKHEVEDARKAGIVVYGMAIGNVNLSDGYGSEAWTPFKGSVAASAQPLAELIAKSWASKDQRR